GVGRSAGRGAAGYAPDPVQRSPRLGGGKPPPATGGTSDSLAPPCAAQPPGVARWSLYLRLDPTDRRLPENPCGPGEEAAGHRRQTGERVGMGPDLDLSGMEGLSSRHPGLKIHGAVPGCLDELNRPRPSCSPRWPSSCTCCVCSMPARSGGTRRAPQLATLPTLREVWASFPHEAFPLLFPGTLRAYTGLFGDSDLAFRLFGLMVGLAILAALWWNARLAGALPLVSIVLIQFHPAFPLYGDSIRGYGLGTLAILLAFGAFARLVAHPDRRSILLAFLAAVASVHLLLHNAALLAGIGGAAAIVGLLRRRFRVTLAALGIGITAALTLLPYAAPLSAAQDWNVLLIEKITLWEVLNKLAKVVGTPFPWLVWVWGGAVVLAAVWTLTPWPPLPPALT